MADRVWTVMLREALLTRTYLEMSERSNFAIGSDDCEFSPAYTRKETDNKK